MSRRIVSAIEYASGRRGPVRSLFNGARRYGVGERIIKTALGALLAWELGRLIPGNPRPYLAPLTVILVLQATIAQSVTFAFQRALGVAIGVMVAFTVLETVGVHGWSIALVILIALVVGTRLRLNPLSTQQVAVSALIVMLLGGSGNEFSFAALRVADTIVGTAVALGINAFFAPPSHLPTAQRSIASLAEEAAAVLHSNAASLAAGVTESTAIANLDRARAVGILLDSAESAIGQAKTSLRYHPFAGAERDDLAKLHRAGAALEHTAIQIRVISRAVLDGARAAAPGRLDWLAPDAMGGSLSLVLASAGAVVAGFYDGATDDGARQAFDLAVRDFAAMREAAIRRAEELVDGAHSDGWVLTGEVLAVAGRLVTDLSNALDVSSTVSM